MSAIILRQTIIMLILILVGVLCSKTGIINKEANKGLSNFLTQIINPVVIFMSYQTDYRPELVKNLLMTFLLSCISYAVLIASSYIFVRRKKGCDTEIERFSSVYSNCGFMGIPLVSALFGDEGVFYLAAFITMFNLLAWTHGMIMLTGEKDIKKAAKVFCSPTVISIFLGLITFFMHVRLPEIPAAAMDLLKAVNTPIAMIVSGVTMADTDIPSLLRKKRVYYVCFLKLLLFPATLAVILSALFGSIDEKVLLTVIVAASAPPAALCTLQCIRYGKNSLFASEIFTLGTVLSIATLPLIVQLTEFLTKKGN
ncbi:MAG: AEC family transporter [Ruminococcus sp.]|nr:AEC family transporter [Ruminococcus sp.]